LLQEAKLEFGERFDSEPAGYARAPGCVNLLGDHTEHFGGQALPVTVDMSVVLAFKPNDRDQVTIHSVYLNRTESFDLAELDCGEEIHWLDYVKGVAELMEQEWQINPTGFDAVLAGNLPVEAGLGASSALTVAATFTFLHLALEERDSVEIARLCQKVETDFVGVHCDLVAPAACVLGQAGMAFKLDCHSLDVQFVPMIPADCTLVVCDSRIRSEDSLNEILSRRDQCREGVRKIAKFVRGREIRTVRDLSLRDFNLYGPMLQPPIRERVKHIVTENERVDECADSLAGRNIVRAGVLLDASHNSLRDDYGVSCKELDLLVEIAWNTRMVYGARMSGQGFGGITINLVEPEGVAHFCETISKQYRARTELTPNVYVCQPERGAELITAEELN
jgi:galactokinase